MEINNQQFRTIGKPGGIDGGLYAYQSLEWRLTGTQQAIYQHNQLQLYKASRTLPTIAYAVRSFTEGARITQQRSNLSDQGAIRTLTKLPKVADVLKAVKDFYSVRPV